MSTQQERGNDELRPDRSAGINNDRVCTGVERCAGCPADSLQALLLTWDVFRNPTITHRTRDYRHVKAGEPYEFIAKTQDKVVLT